MAPRIFRRRRSRNSGASDEGLTEAPAEVVVDDESPPSLVEESEVEEQISSEGIEIFDESGDGAAEDLAVEPEHSDLGDWEGEGGSALPHEDEVSSLAFEPPDEPPPFPFVVREEDPESRDPDFSEEASEEISSEPDADEDLAQLEPEDSPEVVLGEGDLMLGVEDEPGEELAAEDEEELVDAEDGNLVSSDGELANGSPPGDEEDEDEIESVEVTSEDGVEIVPLPADSGAEIVSLASPGGGREPEEAEEIDDEPRPRRQPRVTRELGAADEQAALPSGEDGGRSEIHDLERRVEELAQLVRERIGAQPDPAAAPDVVADEADEVAARYDEEIAELKAEHTEEIAEIEAMHRRELEQAHDDRREELEQIKEEQSEELRALRDTHDAEMRALRAEQALAVENFQRELLELGSRLETTERQLGESERKGREQNERIAERLRETQRENEELRAQEESSQVSESAQRVYASLEQARVEQEADLIAKRDRAITEAGIEAEQIKLAAHVHEGDTLTRLAEVADLERNRMQTLRADAENNVENARQQLNELLETFIHGASSLVAAAKRDSDATRESFLTEKQQLRDENKTLEQQREELVNSTQQITRRLETLLQKLSSISSGNIAAAIALAGESGVDIFAAQPAPVAEDGLGETPQDEILSLESEDELPPAFDAISTTSEDHAEELVEELDLEVVPTSSEDEAEVFAEAEDVVDAPPALLQPLPEDEPETPSVSEAQDSIRSFDELPAVQVAPVARPTVLRPGEGIRSFDEFVDTGE